MLHEAHISWLRFLNSVALRKKDMPSDNDCGLVNLTLKIAWTYMHFLRVFNSLSFTLSGLTCTPYLIPCLWRTRIRVPTNHTILRGINMQNLAYAESWW